MLRRVTASGVVTAVAGTPTFRRPLGVAFDAGGRCNLQRSCEWFSGRIGQGDGPANEARFFNPWGVDVDDQGFVYVLDENNHVVQKIENGMVRTIAATHETLRTFDLAVAPDGAVYTAAGQPSFVGRVAGNRIEEFVGAELEPGNRVGVPGRARLNLNASVDVGPSGRIIIADSGNHCVKVVELTNEPWIDEFNVIPANTAGTVALEWCTEGAQSVTISPDVGSVSGCGTVLVTPAGSITYVLRATGIEGSVEERVTVAVPGNRRLRNRR